jgi:hypothetical protein
MFKKYVIIFAMVGFTSCYIKSAHPVDSPSRSSRSDLLKQIAACDQSIERLHAQRIQNTDSDSYFSLDGYDILHIKNTNNIIRNRDSLKEALDSKLILQSTWITACVQCQRKLK